MDYGVVAYLVMCNGVFSDVVSQVSMNPFGVNEVLAEVKWGERVCLDLVSMRKPAA